MKINKIISLAMFGLFTSSFCIAGEWQGFGAARQAIESHRKADIVIRVVDNQGMPVPNAEVNVEMTRHSFPFGGAISSGSAFTVDGPKPDMAQYLAVFEENFNSAVMENAMKWYGMTNDDGTPDTVAREKMWKCVEWLKARDIPLRGHNGLWASWQFSPDFMYDLRMQPDRLRAEVNARIDTAVTLFKGRLSDWDLVNEPAHHRDIINILGEEEVIAWYKRAHDIDPQTPMYVNQWAVLNDVYHHSFYKWVKYLAASEDASLDGIGLQGHGTVELFTEPDQIVAVWDKLNQYAEFGLPIKITEFDVEGYKGEDLQAQALENALTLFFAHPAVEGFTVWGFWDGKHWRNNPKWSFTGESEQAGFWRQDWTEKQAAKTWKRLIFDDWWTNESGTTDNQARFQTHGFLGDYRIRVRHDDQTKEMTIQLPHQGADVTVTLD